MSTKTKGKRSNAKGSEETVAMEALGFEGDDCKECGAVLAVDQRYCLECGTRRTGPRVDFTQHLESDVPSQGAASSVEGTAQSSGDWGPKSVATGIAALGVMLLLGVLIGRDNDPVQAQQAPIVVGGSGTTTTAGTADTSNGKNGSGGGSGGSGSSGPVTDAASSLKGKGGGDYFEASQKLPDEYKSPGKAPPDDPGKPGGGSGSVVIK